MARTVDLLSMIGLKEAAKNTLEGEELFIADARQRFAYEDDKRTDKVIGTTVTLQIVRNVDNPLSSQTFDIQTDQIFDVEDILDKSATVKIEDVRIWSSSRRNSTYAETHVVLRGTVEVA